MTSTERHEKRYQRRKAEREAKRRKRLDEYDSFERISSPGALLKANIASRKGVLFKANVIRYNVHAFRNAIQVSHNLKAGKDIRQGFYSFTVFERGKERKIHSLHYMERVIRRSVCTNALVPILSSNLIYDNGASLKGKGVSFAADRCEAHLHKFFRETGSNDGYVIVVDFKGYFNNILHKPLNDILDRYVLDHRLNALCKGFIDAGNADKPEAEKGKGLFIGPEDSQIYAVAYPNYIDHKIKDQWGIRYYGRYMDDSYILVKDKDTAIKVLQSLLIEYSRMGIIPNQKKTQIVKLSKGFGFLKTRYILTNTGKVVRKIEHSGIVRERRKLKKQYGLYINGVMTAEQVVQSYMSWRGAALKRDSYQSVSRMDTLFLGLFNSSPWKNKNEKRRKYA